MNRIVTTFTVLISLLLIPGCGPLEERPYLEYQRYDVRIMDISGADSTELEISGTRRFELEKSSLIVRLYVYRLKEEPDQLWYGMEFDFSDHAEKAYVSVEDMKVYKSTSGSVRVNEVSLPELRIVPRYREIRSEKNQGLAVFSLDNTLADCLFFEVPVDDSLSAPCVLGVSARLLSLE